MRVPCWRIVAGVILVASLGCGRHAQSTKSADSRSSTGGATSTAPNLSLHEAAAQGRLDELSKYFVGGTDLDQPNTDGKSALYLAAEAGQSQAVAALLDHGAKNDIGDSHSARTPLHAAALANNPAAIAALIAHGSNASATDTDGNSPLHLAARNDKADAVKALLDAGANFKLKNLRHETTWRLAHEHDAQCVSAQLIADKAGPMIVSVNSNPSGATVRIGARYEQIMGSDGKSHWVAHAEEGRVAGTTPCRVTVTQSDEGPEGGISIYLELQGYWSVIGGCATGTKYENGEVFSELEPGFFDEVTYNLNPH